MLMYENMQKLCSMKVIMVLFSLVLLSSFSVVYAQEMGFYNNERHDFSFEIPTDWSYQEDVVIDAENTEEVFFFPEEFSMENAGDDKTMMDVATAMMGWQFQFESPLIGVDYRNIPTSEISSLTEKNIKEFFLEETMELDPTGKIVESYSKTHSYGWEVGIISTSDLDLGYGSPMLYKQEEKLFVFKDRKVYGVAYGSFEKYYDEYKSVYDHVMDTITIKSVVVAQTSEEIDPEIQSIFDDIDDTVSDVESLAINGKYEPLADKELLEKYKMSFDRFEKIASLMDEVIVVDYLVQENKKLGNMLGLDISNDKVKAQLLIYINTNSDNLQTSENIIYEGDEVQMNEMISDVQENFQELIVLVEENKGSQISNDIAEKIIQYTEKIIDDSKYRDINVIALPIEEENYVNFLTFESVSDNIISEEIPILANELIERGFRIEPFVVVEQETGFKYGQVILSPDLEQLETELEKAVIPSWIKINTEAWTRGIISDTDYLHGLEYIISNEIIKIPKSYDDGMKSEDEGLSFKVFAQLWLDEKFSDNVFAYGIQDLISQGVIEEYPPKPMEISYNLAEFQVKDVGIY